MPINIKYICHFSFLAHCVCNRCCKNMDPLSKNWGSGPPQLPPPVDAPMVSDTIFCTNTTKFLRAVERYHKTEDDDCLKNSEK